MVSADPIHKIVNTVMEFLGPSHEEHSQLEARVFAAFKKSQKLNEMKQEEEVMVGTFFGKMNQAIHSDFEKYHKTAYAKHIHLTRSLICKGAKELKERARIIVLGPGQIEPLEDLSLLSLEVTLVDFVEASIKKMASRLQGKTRCVPFDLSRGIVGEVKNLIAAIRLKQLDKAGFTKEVVDFLRKVKSASQPLSQEIGQAEYVVSSFIITQMANQATLYIEKRMVELYGEWKEPEDHDLIEQLRHAMDNFRETMQEQHLRDLCSLSTPGGLVYLSDAVAGIESSHEIHETDQPTFPMISPAILKKIGVMFHVVETASWIWESVPPGSFAENLDWRIAFKVQAYLLRTPRL